MLIAQSKTKIIFIAEDEKIREYRKFLPPQTYISQKPSLK